MGRAALTLVSGRPAAMHIRKLCLVDLPMNSLFAPGNPTCGRRIGGAVTAREGDSNSGSLLINRLLLPLNLFCSVVVAFPLRQISFSSAIIQTARL
jgi:hypothetical protein